ncbi:hypothetical protein [Gluconobacter morbifer]|uniref:Lipoprotein n=1 Tax=Gluconobacter morbifer G707 TaxID=1088869 RepID=G6XJY7_9PROT|nr:hypothetical protein [Gluconobacter morbifer]EHH67949.1 hypothetical protein GMO_17160 [Gluconobacter morbifer G707]
MYHVFHRVRTDVLIIGALVCALPLALGGCVKQSALSPDFPTTMALAQGGGHVSRSGDPAVLLGAPELATASYGNLTGALRYCVQQGFVSGRQPMPLVNASDQEPDALKNTDFHIGQQGVLQAIGSQTRRPEQYALPSLPEPMRRQACSAIADHLQTRHIRM